MKDEQQQQNEEREGDLVGMKLGTEDRPDGPNQEMKRYKNRYKDENKYNAIIRLKYLKNVLACQHYDTI